MSGQIPSRDEVVRILGRVDDHAVAEIIALGTTIDELEEAAAHLALETDLMGELKRPLSGRARIVYDMVRRSEGLRQEDR